MYRKKWTKDYQSQQEFYYDIRNGFFKEGCDLIL